MNLSNKPNEELETIQRKISAHYGIPMDVFLSKSRVSNIAHPRMLAMYLVRKTSALSLMEIGHQFGGRDPGTVINACKRVSMAIEKNPNLNETIERIMAGDDANKQTK